MTDKPLPARLPKVEAANIPARPKPARALGDPDGGTAGGAHPPQDAPGPTGAEPDVPEVSLEVDGATWRVRVVGRSGRSDGRSPPLLTLGFWPPGEPGPQHAREATVVARALAELPDARLLEALGGASSPPAPERKRPFFDAVGGGRRGGPRQDG